MKKEGTTGEHLNSSPLLIIVLGSLMRLVTPRNYVALIVSTSTDPTNNPRALEGVSIPNFPSRVVHPTQLCQNCAKTLSVLSIGDSLEREADSPSCCKH